MNPNTLHSSKNDTVSDDVSESLVTPFEDCLVSVCVPETNIQSHSGCSDDEGSSEELPKQYWRAERFHTEEFLEMQVINAA